MHAEKQALVSGVLEGAAGAATLDAAQLVELLGASSEVGFDDDPAEASELDAPPAPETVPAPVARPPRQDRQPHALLGLFRDQLAESGNTQSTTYAYTCAVGRWLATRPRTEPARALALAALAAADAPAEGLPWTTRAALRRFGAMIVN